MTENTTQQNKMDKQAMMETYAQLATPGPPHELLAQLVGTWDTRTRCWMEPDQAPMESFGTSRQSMVLGGRFLEQKFEGDMMGTAYTGFGMTGYDNFKQKFVSTWTDCMGTGILYFEGTADSDGKRITQECSHDDPVRGPVTWRSVTCILDENTHTFELFSRTSGGKEDKMMEITYSRKR